MPAQLRQPFLYLTSNTHFHKFWDYHPLQLTIFWTDGSESNLRFHPIALSTNLLYFPLNPHVLSPTVRTFRPHHQETSIET